jgi:hypothetical protein
MCLHRSLVIDSTGALDHAHHQISQQHAACACFESYDSQVEDGRSAIWLLKREG